MNELNHAFFSMTFGGEALSLAPQLRDKMQIISKCGIKPMFGGLANRYVNHYDTSKQHIITSVERSLT